MKRLLIALTLVCLSSQAFAQKTIPLPTNPIGKDIGVVASAPEIFIGTIFSLAFIIGHDHWLGCKNLQAGSIERDACQKEPMWPNKVPTVMSVTPVIGNAGNFSGDNSGPIAE